MKTVKNSNPDGTTTETIYYPDGSISLRTLQHKNGKIEIKYHDNGKPYIEKHLDLNNNLHRKDNYAERVWDRKGNLVYEQWAINNKRHREDGPAVQTFRGNSTSELWYQNGKRHRPDGPAVVEYNNNRITHEEYWLNDEKVLKGYLGASQQGKEIKQLGPFIKDDDLEELWIKYRYPKDAEQSVIPSKITLFSINGRYEPKLETKTVPAYLYSEASFDGIGYTGSAQIKEALHHFPIGKIENSDNDQTIYACIPRDVCDGIISVPQHHGDRYKDLIKIGSPPVNKLSPYPSNPPSALVLVGSEDHSHIKNFTDTLNLLRYKPEDMDTYEFLYTATLGHMGTHYGSKNPEQYFPYAKIATEIGITMSYVEQKQFDISQRQQKLQSLAHNDSSQIKL